MIDTIAATTSEDAKRILEGWHIFLRVFMAACHFRHEIHLGRPSPNPDQPKLISNAGR
jgi:hypothetical protein